jgi:hypothetical protein
VRRRRHSRQGTSAYFLTSLRSSCARRTQSARFRPESPAGTEARPPSPKSKAQASPPWEPHSIRLRLEMPIRPQTHQVETDLNITPGNVAGGLRDMGLNAIGSSLFEARMARFPLVHDVENWALARIEGNKLQKLAALNLAGVNVVVVIEGSRGRRIDLGKLKAGLRENQGLGICRSLRGPARRCTSEVDRCEHRRGAYDPHQ